MKQNIDKYTLEHIKVLECVVETLDQQSALQIKRVVEEYDDKLVISSLCHEEGEVGEVSIPTDSTHILAAALQLMEDE